MATLIYPDGRQVHYEYNAVNQLVLVRDWAGREKHYYYDDNGRPVRVVRPNGTELTLSYNLAGQLVQQRDVDSQGHIISQFELVYDAAGNIIKEETLPAPEPFVLPTAHLTYSLANQLATYNEQATQFDADGNMTHGPLRAQMVNFSYDSRNRLTQAGNTAYRYNAENQRVSVSVNGPETRYVVNSQPVLSQTLVRTRPDGTQTYYVYGLGLMAEETNGEYLTYHYDLRGSTVALTESTGQVNARFQYTPFGMVVSATPVETPFLYHGMYGVMTDESGLYYMRARYYSPEIRRFLNQDVLLGYIANRQTLNRYAFVNGNPVSFVDPEGQLGFLAGLVIVNALMIAYDIYSVITFDPSDYPNGSAVPMGFPLLEDIAAGSAKLIQKGVKGCAGLFSRSVNGNAANGVLRQYPYYSGSIYSDDLIDMYRGLRPDHPQIDYARKGIAKPKGGHSDPVRHNYGETNSVFTSWTASEATALVHGSMNGPGGILLHKRFNPTDFVPSPDEMGESEKLLRTVTGANVSTIICNMCVD